MNSSLPAIDRPARLEDAVRSLSKRETARDLELGRGRARAFCVRVKVLAAP